MKTLRGLAASRGIAIGPAFRLGARPVDVARRSVADRAAEKARLAAALATARDQIAALVAQASIQVGDQEAAIFEAHALMLEDPELKIGRPRQLYTGKTYRDYVEVEDR